MRRIYIVEFFLLLQYIQLKFDLQKKKCISRNYCLAIFLAYFDPEHLTNKVWLKYASLADILHTIFIILCCIVNNFISIIYLQHIQTKTREYKNAKKNQIEAWDYSETKIWLISYLKNKKWT